MQTASKAKVEGIVKVGTTKGDDFSDFSFKEGTTATLSLKDIFVQEHGKADSPVAAPAAPKVKGGAKATAKAGAKKSAQKAVAKKSETVEKVLKYTPSKSVGKKETPQKSTSAATGKQSAKKSVGKKNPAMPSPGGKKSTKTTDQMTMSQFKKYLDWHEAKKGGKVLGKRSTAGKASAASGKASKAGKRSKK